MGPSGLVVRKAIYNKQLRELTRGGNRPGIVVRTVPWELGE